MSIIILFVLLGLAKSFDFDHPTTLTIFSWRIDFACMRVCRLVVMDKNTNNTMDFLPNTEYSSCQYTGDYWWDIICNKSCIVFEDLLRKYSYITLNASKETKVIEVNNSIVTVNYIPCDTYEGQYLFMKFTIDYNWEQLWHYDDPLLIYYAKHNIYSACNLTQVKTGAEMPFKYIHNSINGQRHYIFDLPLILGCYDDSDNNYFKTHLRNYYFKFRGSGKLSYSIGNLHENTFNTYAALFWILFIMVFILGLIVILYNCFRCKYQNNNSRNLTHDIINDYRQLQIF